MLFFCSRRNLFGNPTSPRPRKRRERKLQIDALEDRAVPAAPAIEPIADRTLVTNQSVLQIPVVATDADGDAIDLDVRTAASADYFLLADLKLKNGNRPANWGGEQEKWFRSSNEWYFIKPDGDLYRWDGALRQATGTKVASLPPVHYYLTDLVTKPRNQDLASIFNQRLGLAPTVSPEANSLGQNEKWLRGAGGSRYFIVPDGTLYRAYAGGTNVLYGKLGQSYYDDLARLYNARPQLLTAVMKGSMLQIDQGQGAAGEFAVQVAATDGTSTSSQTFSVIAPRVNAPVIPQQPPQVLGVGEQSLQINLNATDADGDALTYTAKAAGSEAYFHATELQLKSSSRKVNWGRQGERWFTGQGNFYFILPSGDLYRWDGTPRQASGDYIATLPPVYFYYPDLLTKPKDQDLAYVLDQRLGLSPTASPAPGSLGLQEKWLSGLGGKARFFVTPEGAFYRGGRRIVWLADLGPGYYKQPARLYAAARDRFGATIDANGTLDVQTKANYIGQFAVQVSATDGTFTTTQIIPFTQSDYENPNAPRVVGALSTTNRTVIVSFSQPMNNSAVDPANYEISQLDAAGNLIAGLSVLSAKFYGADRTAVELTTISQSEVKYTVKAVNVKDLGGKAIAPPSIIAGVPVDPSRTEFLGKPPSAADMIDSDGDGLRDHEEQRGWTVQVKMLNGSVVGRWASSDPFNADSDNDGLSDSQEANLRYDPRDADTDDDQLNDYQEFNEIYSDGINQDSDGDGLDDSVEFNFYRSSVVDADTDGDQLNDGAEILLGGRNVRIADVPKPGIEVGAVDLQLDVRFTATSSKGTRDLESKSVNSTLTQSASKEFARTDASSHEVSVKAGFEHGWSVTTGVNKGTGSEFKFSVEAGWTGNWSSSFTSTSSQQTQNEVAKSYQTDAEVTQEETVNRSIEGATMKVAVNIQSLSNLAFNIKNLQITAFVQDPAQAGRLIPIATLVPEVAEPQNGFTLGPLVPERGPLVFVNDQIYPALVESLMRNPQGLVFKIANYDIIDERGRNFAFTSEEIFDRTAPLVIDFGFSDELNLGLGAGATERYRVATSGGRIAIDTNGDGNVDDNDRPVVYDENGGAVGISITDAMSNILGLTKYDEDTTPSSSLGQLALLNSYSTRVVDGVERLWRVRGVSRELSNPLKGWIIYTPDGIDGSTDFSDLVLTTDGGLTFKFMQDLDNDGIDAAQEFVLGSSDTKTNSDGDDLPDAFEFFGRMPNADPNDPFFNLVWNVDVVGQPTVRAFSSPARSDSDLDGIDDDAEFNRFVDIDTNGDGTPDVFNVRKSTNPRSADTDDDGVSDFDEINGYDVKLRFPVGGQSTINVKSDPLNPDTDGDTMPDGDERTLGIDPTKNDKDKVLDDDGDGLVNFQEDEGWDVVWYGVSTTPNQQGASSTLQDVKPKKNDPDSDDDGLTDKEEYILGTNPNVSDTDSDGLSDISELTVVNNQDGTRTLTLKYNPLDADVDNDLRSDGAEVNAPILVSVFGQTPYEVFSDPTKANVDNDGLVDGQEATAGTDPTKFDTDGDNAGVGDGTEIGLGTNPLRKDQKVTVTITQLQLLNFDGEDEIGSTSLQILGSIWVGKPGNMQKIYEATYDENRPGDFFADHDLDLANNEVATINKSLSFILLDGESLRIENRDLRDNDGISSDDVFSNAQKDHDYAITDGDHSITSTGIGSGPNGSNDGDDEIGAQLVTSYSLKVVTEV